LASLTQNLGGKQYRI